MESTGCTQLSGPEPQVQAPPPKSKGLVGWSRIWSARPAVTMTSEADTKAAIVSGTNTVAYLAYSGIRIENLPLHAIPLDGQAPEDFSGAYPLEVRQLGVAYLPANVDQIQPFLDFIVEPQAQALLAEHGIGPAHISSVARSWNDGLEPTK